MRVAERPLRALAALLLAALAGCASPAPLPPADVWLLGEIHDNAAGHRERLAALRARIDAGWRPALVMEQFDRDRQAQLDAALRDCDSGRCVAERAGGRGWDWSLYEPLLDLALRERLPVVAANLSRDEARRIAREGFGAAFDAATRAAWGLDAPLPADLAEAQTRDIVDSHCGQLPASAAPGMLRAQVARDVSMAQGVARHAGRGAVLIAGNGHVRRDVGVPRWLARRGLASLAVGFVEAEEPGRYDLQRVVPAQDRPDPCAGFGATG